MKKYEHKFSVSERRFNPFDINLLGNNGERLYRKFINKHRQYRVPVLGAHFTHTMNHTIDY